MNKIVEKDNEDISSKIYEVRGVQVMFSSDVALLYRTETKVINQTIKRNIMRFPESFCFQLTKEELDQISLRSQIVTLNSKDNMRGMHYKYMPYVLTEQGIMMLSGLLKSDIAAKVNVQIIEAFVSMKKYISNTLVNQSFINNLVYRHDEEIKVLKDSFDKLQEKEKINTIFFEGQIYDAYSILIDIFNKSKEEIIIIDNYADKELLDILKNLNKRIIIISKNMGDILIKKYKSQYSNVEFKQMDSFHDRFIIIDKKALYHCGSSFKDLGKKCFAINKMESKETLKYLLDKIFK